MKRFSRFALVWLAVGFALAPLRAQEAPKKAPGPAPSQSEGVLEAWNDIGRKLIAMAQDFPEDKFSYKPQADLGRLSRTWCMLRRPCTFSRIPPRGRNLGRQATPTTLRTSA